MFDHQVAHISLDSNRSQIAFIHYFYRVLGERQENQCNKMQSPEQCNYWKYSSNDILSFVFGVKMWNDINES